MKPFHLSQTLLGCTLNSSRAREFEPGMTDTKQRGITHVATADCSNKAACNVDVRNEIVPVQSVTTHTVGIIRSRDLLTAYPIAPPLSRRRKTLTTTPCEFRGTENDTTYTVSTTKRSNQSQQSHQLPHSVASSVSFDATKPTPISHHNSCQPSSQIVLETTTSGQPKYTVRMAQTLYYSVWGLSDTQEHHKSTNYTITIPQQMHFEYRTRECIGKGGTSVCFRVEEWDVDNNHHIRDLACKVVPKAYYASSLSKKQKIIDEVQLHRRLQHQFIVGFKNIMEDDAHIYILTELCTGTSLRDVLEKRVEPFSEKQVRNYMHQLLSVIEYLHKQQIMHRDIKVGNIFLPTSQSDTIRVGDFGFAYRWNARTRRLVSPCGTPNYSDPSLVQLTLLRNQWRTATPQSTTSLSPSLSSKYNTGGLPSHSHHIHHSRNNTPPNQSELMRQLERFSYGCEVDIWAAGVSMYAMRNRSPTFHHKRIADTHRAILAGTFVSKYPLSEDGDEVLAAMLNKDAFQRPTASQLLLHPYFVFIEYARPAGQPRRKEVILSWSFRKRCTRPLL